MKTIITTAILGTALIAMPMTEARSETVKELVGYNVTTVTPADIVTTDGPTSFNLADKNNDGLLSLKEFKAKANLDDEYNRFITLDKNSDKMLDLKEYTQHAPGKGNTVISEGEKSKVSKRNWNIKTTATIENEFVPVISETPIK